MKKQLLLILCAVSLWQFASAQRYSTEIFSDVSVQQNIVYGDNFSVLTGTPTSVQLKMDVYTPVGDVETSRPVVVMLHTGSFLPAIINQTPTGSMRDSAIVEMCSRFARRGYVAISADYRTGWNPQAVGSAGQDIRTGSLLQAVYRSILDIKACVRYIKNDVATANTYGIDTTKIILGGMGSGGYIALAYATIQDTADFNLPKFISSTTNASYGFVAGSSYVNTGLWGDIEGYGGTPGLNNPNNTPGRSADVAFVFNCGGALGDSSWLRAGDVPMVCFHPVTDPFAPYGDGTVIVPTTGDPVVDVSGSQTIVTRANALGNNDCFLSATFTDPFTAAADLNNNGQDGLFPFLFATPQAGPWEWFDSTTTVQVAIALGLGQAAGTQIYQNAKLTNPDMSKAKGMAYIDTIQGYVNPRMIQCLGLNVGITDLGQLNQQVSVYPNPSAGAFTVDLRQVADAVSYIRVADLTGQIVRDLRPDLSGLNPVDAAGLSKGVYTVRVGFSNGEVVRKVVLQ